jgi:16S rRNA (cytosine967-C5)-methyltransferase
MHLASLMERRGRIVAVDVSGEKLARIERGCRRMGIDIVTPCHAESLAELEPESFELVLADVPCSNTGVLARRVEARWRFGEPALASLVADQKFLAELAWAFVRPGGRLAYSTCSLVEAENAAVARWLGRRHGELSLEGESLTLPEGADDPTRWRDGGYLAVFSRR